MKTKKGIGQLLTRILLIGIGMGLFLWFFLPLWAVRIRNLGNVTGMVCALLLVAVGIFWPGILTLIQKGWAILPARIGILGVGAVLVAILTLIAVETSCMIYAATRTPKEAKVLVVLGCKAHADRPSEMLASRLKVALRYLEENPETVCILSGGKGEDEPITEARCMYDYLRAHDIPETRLLLEEESASTRENLEYSLALIREKGYTGEVAVLTNEFHEYRACYLAGKLGISFSAVPAPSPLWLLPTYYVRELYGILHLWLLE